MRARTICVLIALLTLIPLLAASREGLQGQGAHASTTWTPLTSSRGTGGDVPWHSHSGLALGGGNGTSVDMQNGNAIVRAPGLSFPGLNGMNVGVAPIYNSRIADGSTDLGNGWSLGTGRDMGLAFSGASPTFYDATGFPWTFTVLGSSYVAPPGLDATLVKNGDGTYTLTDNSSGTALHFDTTGYLLTMRNHAGNQVSFTYDTNGRLTQITNPQGQATAVAYNAQNLISQVTDPANRVWSYGYDSNNNLTQITDPANNSTNFTYDGFNELNKIVDPKGNTTLIGYTEEVTYYTCDPVPPNPCTPPPPTLNSEPTVNAITRVTDLVNHTGPTWGYSFTSPTSTSVIDPNNHTTSYGFDTSGRVTSTTDPLNHTSQQSWNADNQIVTDTSPLSHVTTYGYNSLHDVTSEQLPNGQTSHWAYTNSTWPHQPSSSTDEEGRITTYGYTSQGLLNSVTDPSNHTRTATYNSDGTVASATDENGHTTAYTYASSTNCTTGTIAGFLSRVDYPHLSGQASPLGSNTFTYDCADRLSSQQDGKGQLTTYSYDALDRTTGVSYNDNTAQFYQYDANSNQTRLDDYTPATGHSYTTYTYNSLEQHTQKSLPNSQTIAYTYDGTDNLLTKTDSSGTVTYAYNADDTLASVKDPQNLQTSFAYDNDGRQTGMTYPNGVTESSGYDNSDQLTQIAAIKGTTHLTSFSYNYTNPGTSTYTTSAYSVTDLSGNVTKYGYDSLSQVTSAVQKTSGGTTLHNWTYGFDPTGNMTAINGSTATYNVADQLTGFGGHTYNYDLNGNQSSSTSGNGFSYNAQDQATAITPSGGSAIPMTYTGAGQSQRTGNGPIGYQYDNTGMGSTTASGSTTYFTATPDGQVLSERIPGGSTGCSLPTGQWCAYYYLHDALGSVIKVVDSSGAVQDSYSYDPYGNASSVTENVPNLFRYIGAIWDAPLGLYKMGARYYDPNTGRFTQRDPDGGGYSYSGGDPVNMADPSGLRPGCANSGGCHAKHKKHKKDKKHKPHHATTHGNVKPIPIPAPTPTPTPGATPTPTVPPSKSDTFHPGGQIPMCVGAGVSLDAIALAETVTGVAVPIAVVTGSGGLLFGFLGAEGFC